MLAEIGLLHHALRIIVMLDCCKILGSRDLPLHFYKSYCHFAPPSVIA